MTRSLAALAAGLAMTGAAAMAADEQPAFEDVVYLTCEEVAARAGDDEEQIVAMVRVLAAFSLERRGLVVPEDREDLSLQFGELIRALCTAHPDDLFYNAVDKSMRRLL